MSNSQINERLVINSESEPLKETPATYVVYPQRWASLFALFLVLFINGASYIFYTPIIVYAQKVYDMPLLALNSIYMIYMAMYIIGSFGLSTYTIEKHGVGCSLVLGIEFCIIGIIMRILINQAFWWIILSSVFCGLSQPLLYNTPPKNSANWFAPNQRTIATTITAFASPIGCAVGSLFPFFYVDSSLVHGRVKIYRATAISSLIFIAIFYIGLLMYVDKPKTPPSSSAAEAKSSSRQEIWAGVKRLLKLKNFWVGSMIYILLTVTYSVTSVSLAAFLDPFNYNANKVSYCSIIFAVFGIMGAVGHGIYLGYTQKFKTSLLFISIGSTIAYTLLLIVIGLKMFWLVLTLCAVLGFFILPIASVGMEFTCEISYPTGEASVSGILTSFREFSTMVMTLISGIVLNNVSPAKVYLFGFILVGICGVTIVLTLFVNTTLLRTKNDTEKSTAANKE